MTLSNKRPQDQTTEEWLASWQKRDNELTAQEKDMNINDVYTSGGKFLRADDLKGSKIELQISEVGSHTFNQGATDEKTQIVLSFAGKEKKLGLNVTNANTIAGLFGNETDDWIGKNIKIFPTKTEFGGEQVPCIRIDQPQPEEAKFDDIPF